MVFVPISKFVCNSIKILDLKFLVVRNIFLVYCYIFTCIISIYIHKISSVTKKRKNMDNFKKQYFLSD